MTDPLKKPEGLSWNSASVELPEIPMLPAGQDALSATISAVYIAFKHIFREGPTNAGCFRPITVIAPESTFLHAVYPRPVAGCSSEVSQRVINVVIGAMAKRWSRYRSPAFMGRQSAASMSFLLIMWLATYDGCLRARNVPPRTRRNLVGRIKVCLSAPSNASSALSVALVPATSVSNGSTGLCST